MSAFRLKSKVSVPHSSSAAQQPFALVAVQDALLGRFDETSFGVPVAGAPGGSGIWHIRDPAVFWTEVESAVLAHGRWDNDDDNNKTATAAAAATPPPVRAFVEPYGALIVEFGASRRVWLRMWPTSVGVAYGLATAATAGETFRRYGEVLGLITRGGSRSVLCAGIGL